MAGWLAAACVLGLVAAGCSSSGGGGETPDKNGADPSVSGSQADTPPQPDDVVDVPADGETEPVEHSGDAADEPAVWVHPKNPKKSLIIGNDKRGALETYNLDGSRQQQLTSDKDFWGNVDVRQGVDLGGSSVDLVAAANSGVRLFTVDATTRNLEPLGPDEGRLEGGFGEGLCLYDGGADGLFVFVILRTGEVNQLQLNGSTPGEVSAEVVRTFAVGSEAEGCVVDDENKALYIAEEGTGLWRYGADPSTGTERDLVDGLLPDGHQTADVEGVTLVENTDGSGVIIASSQTAKDVPSYFTVYDRETNDYAGSFEIVDGEEADGCSHTDGITASSAGLGKAFPDGVFICQDDANTAPGSAGNQNFKLTRLERVLP